MIKYFYFIIQEERNGKKLAYVDRATTTENLISKFKTSASIKTVNIARTKLEAEDIVHILNQSFLI